MPRMVLDASAVLALLNAETGAEVVEQALDAAAISAVNYSEVMTKLIEHGMMRDAASVVVDYLGLEIVAFDAAQAGAAAALRSATRRFGLSLADRACLALAEMSGMPVLTADRNWSRLRLDIDVRLIR